ncbi:MAG: glycosyltransferase family 39 protein [Anaerolineae bacterium]
MISPNGGPEGTRRAMAAVLVAFIILASAYNFVVPVFEAPDEHTHYFFAQHVAQTGRLPVQTTDPDQRGPWEQEGSQPPLYYLLVAPLVRASRADLTEDDLRYNHQNSMGHPAVVGNENRFVHPPGTEGWPWHGYALATHLGRALSTLLSAATVLLVWWIAGRVLPGRDWLAVAAAATAAFVPQFTFTSAALTNDNLITLLATAALALLLRLSEDSGDRRTIVALAAVSGLAPLTKLSGLAVLGFSLATIGAIAWRQRDRSLLLRAGLPVALVAAALSGWWYARNWVLYGDVTGISHMLPGGLRRDFEAVRWLAGLPSELVGMWYSGWGLFGWFTILLPQWAYVLVTATTAVALAGLALAALRRAGWINWPRLTWLGLWAVVVFVSLLRWMTVAKGAHGRLLYPAIAFAAVAIVAGLRQAAPARVGDRALAVAVAISLFLFSALSLFAVIRPAFAGPSVIAAVDIPDTALRSDVVFGEGLRLVAADLPDRVVGGDVAPVTLYWQADAPIERDGFVTVRVDQSVEVRDETQPNGYRSETTPGTPQLGYLAGGTTPPAFLAPDGGVYVDVRQVAFPPLVGGGAGSPPDAPQSTEARLSVHVYDQDAREAWPVIIDGAEESGDWHGAVVIDPPDAMLLDQLDEGVRAESLLASFEDGVELLRARPDDNSPQGGRGWLTGTRTPDEMAAAGIPRGNRGAADAYGNSLVTWLPTEAIDEDLTAFIHVVDQRGDLLAAFDRPPATHGPYRTSVWSAGVPVVAELPWWMFESAAGNRGYSVLIGLYHPADGSRVPAYRADGSRWPSDAVQLMRVADDASDGDG